MFHLLGYSVVKGASEVLTALPPMADQLFPNNQNNQFVMPQQVQLIAVHLAGANVGRGQINSPSLRTVGLPDIYPVTLSVAVPNLPQLDFFYGTGPIIPKGDPLEIDSSNSLNAADTQYALAWVADGNRNVAPGQSVKIRATSPGVAAGTFNWQPQALTLSTQLPYGTWAVTGLVCTAANLNAGRLIFVGGGWRPGCLAGNGFGGYPNQLFTSGLLGEYGRFESNAQPSAEVFALGATGVINWYLDLVKVS